MIDCCFARALVVLTDLSPRLCLDDHCVVPGTAITEDAYKEVSPFPLDVNEGVISIIAFDGDHCVQVGWKLIKRKINMKSSWVWRSIADINSSVSTHNLAEQTAQQQYLQQRNCCCLSLAVW